MQVLKMIVDDKESVLGTTYYDLLLVLEQRKDIPRCVEITPLSVTSKEYDQLMKAANDN